MSHIVVTQAAVRSLASALSKVDTSSLKHGDRLSLIAESFGWKVDAFMHALKQDARKSVNNPSEISGRSPQFRNFKGEIPTLESLGISRVSAWKDVVDQPSGLIIVTGPVGAGKNMTLVSTARYLASMGRRLHIPNLMNDFSSLDDIVTNDVVVFGGIRDAADAEAAVKLAETGMLVLASMTKTPCENLFDLVGLGIARDRLKSVRAILLQYLVRKIGPNNSEISVSASKYSGQTPVNSLHIFNDANTVETFMKKNKQSKMEIVADLTSKVARNITDLSEVERCFGEEYRTLVASDLREF